MQRKRKRRRASDSLLYRYNDYLRRLKRYQKLFSATPRRAKLIFPMREDLIYYGAIQKETRFLLAHQIYSRNDLAQYQKDLFAKLSNLDEEKKELRKKLKDADDSATVLELQAKTETADKTIKKIRKDVGLCNKIFVRAPNIKHKLNLMRLQERDEIYDNRQAAETRKR
jgi:hypothetical protein